MDGGKDLQGVEITEAEAASGLGFKSVADMRKFYEHIGEIQKIVGPKLERIFGDRPGSQWCFEISAAVVEYLIHIEGTAERETA